MRAAVISGGDPAPVLDPAKDIFDLVALSVEVLVVVILDLPVLSRRDARRDAAFGQSSAEPVAVIALIREQFLGLREC